MSALTTEQIAANIIAKLAVTAPGLSLEVGTPERKIVEAAAEAIFENQVDSQLISSQLDVDTKSGTDLEDFVGVFAFGRLQGNYAVGSVTFTLTIPATQPVLIPFGTQVFKPGNVNEPNINYTTTAGTTIDVGDQTATVPIQATIVGSLGNAPSASVTGFPAGFGISTVTNIESFTGGADDESDDALRARFKKTFLRNIAGTSDFYTGLALQAKSVSRVKILGPNNRYDAQIQSGAAATPVNVPSKNCKYVWPEGYSVSKNKGLPTQEWFTDVTDYAFTTGAITFPVLTPTTNTDNEFLDISYEYTSSNSRNDPINGIFNKVDLYVDGSAPLQITEKVFTKAVTLSVDPNSVNYTGNFKSYPSGTTLTGGTTKYQRLGSTPILDWPEEITVGVTTYNIGTHYFGLRGTTLNKGSEREIAGIGWIATPPADGLVAMVTYTYNQVPEVLNSIIKKTKQITSDPLVHSAEKKFFSMYFVVQFDIGSNITDVTTRAEVALTNYLNSLSFGAWIQISDLTTYLHNVPGIDNIRIATTGGDGAPHSIAEMEEGVATGTVYTADFQLSDNQIPALDSIHLLRRSFNNFA